MWRKGFVAVLANTHRLVTCRLGLMYTPFVEEDESTVLTLADAQVHCRCLELGGGDIWPMLVLVLPCQKFRDQSG